MSRQTGGSFATSAFSNQGTSGSFDARRRFDNDHHHHHHHGSAVHGYNDSVPPYNDSVPPSSSPCCSFSLFSIACLLVGSLWLFFGFYANQHLELGQLSSHLLKANSLFVKEILVQNPIQTKGLDLYEFSKHPPLDKSAHWIEEHHTFILRNHHHEWALWLNKGSKVQCHYEVSESSNGLLFAIIQGDSNLKAWIEGGSDVTVVQKDAKGNGSLGYEVKSDDAYYFTFGNFQQGDAQVKLKLQIDSRLYSTDEATNMCHVDHICAVKVSFLGSDMALLMTPKQHPGGVDVWHVIVTYKTRFATHLLAYGFILCAIICFIKKRWPISGRHNDDEHSPLVPPARKAAPVANPENPDLQYQENVEIQGLLNPDRYEGTATGENTCAICFEASKDSFFSPCGHCATCYGCGLRIKEGRDPRCPICRQLIGNVNKLYVS